MTTVYTHIKPFEKRAINFLQQCVGSFGGPEQLHGTISELTRRQEFFAEFLTSFGPSLTDKQREYLDASVVDIERALGEASAEKVMLESILKLLNPCRACHGNGDIRTLTGRDESYTTTCEGCGGIGVYKGAE